MDISASQSGWRREARAGQQKPPGLCLVSPPLVHSFPFSLCPAHSHSLLCFLFSISPSLADRALNMHVNAHAAVIARIIAHYLLLSFALVPPGVSRCYRGLLQGYKIELDCGFLFYFIFLRESCIM